MVRTHEAEKSRQKQAAENMSKVQRLHRALQSGAIKSELRTLSEAIHAARALYKQIEAEGIPPKDFVVHIAYLTPDLSSLFVHRFVAGHEAETQAKLSGECCIMAGLTFALRDRERSNWIVAARPFLKTPLVETAFKNWVDETFMTNM